MAVNVAGLVSIIVFYLLILVVGILAARKTGLKVRNISRQDVMMAGRNIGLFVGIFTMTATWVGGGYINGSAEVVAGSGLVWCQAPLGYAVSLIVGGLCFVEKMRGSGFSTLLDPFLHKFGRLMGCLLYLPALSAEVFWSAAILNALGATLKVILDIDLTLSIIISAAIALLYTLLGGLYSVAYTDVVQLICIFIGLVYWQRALSARTVGVAKGLSLIGGFGCIIMAIPAALFGAIAYTADWSLTSYGNATILPEDASLTLPLVYFHLTPVAVSFVGLGAVSAAVMSSTDSSILSASTMFAVNVFSVIHEWLWGNRPSDTVVVWVMRAAQVVIAIMACAMAISVSSIYYLFLLCSDFVYVVLFPQLLCVLYIHWSNSYGSLAGFVIGLLFRFLGGEPGLKLPPTIEYPWMDPDSGQQFPFRTLSMLISVVCILFFSALAKLLFTRSVLPPSADVFRCFSDSPQGARQPPAQKAGVLNTAYVPEAKLVRFTATTPI